MLKKAIELGLFNEEKCFDKLIVFVFPALTRSSMILHDSQLWHSITTEKET